MAIETALPSEFAGATPAEQLSKFRETLLSKSSLKITSEKPVGAEYRNRMGDSIECVFDGSDKVNGAVVDYKSWPISESPWTSMKTTAGPMVLTDGKKSRTYDFVNWTISDQSVPVSNKK